MLTLKEINDVSFRKSSFSGYKPEDVDDFIDEVTESFKVLVRENQASNEKIEELAAKNADLVSKLKILAEKIESYRGDEDGIKNALLSAQKLSATSIKEAKIVADEILTKANKNAEEIIEEAKNNSVSLIEKYDAKIKAKEREYEEAKSQVTAFKASLFEMYKNHVSEIESIPDFYEEDEKRKIIEKRKLATQAAKKEEPVAKEPVKEVEKPVLALQKNVAEQAEKAPAPVRNIESDTIAVPSVTEKRSRNERRRDVRRDRNEKRMAPETVSKSSFDSIDFGAYTDIPDVYKNDKEKLFDTLEFGEAIDISKKK